MSKIEYSLLESIQNRRSFVSFSQKPVEPQKLEMIFEAARWAASAFNTQPWRFIYAVKGEEGYSNLNNLLFDGNRIWAGSAPLLILSLAETIDTVKNRENNYALHDTGMATANMLLQADSMGLVTHPMAGFDKIMAREVFGFPSNIQPVAMIAMGYPGNPDELSEDLRKRQTGPRIRKPLEEFVFKGKWN